MNTKEELYAVGVGSAAGEEWSRQDRDRRTRAALGVRQRRSAAEARGGEDRGQRLRQQIAARLKLLGLTERQASLQAGLSPDCVKEIVAGRRQPRAATLKRIARVLGCELDA